MIKFSKYWKITREGVLESSFKWNSSTSIWDFNKAFNSIKGFDKIELYNNHKHKHFIYIFQYRKNFKFRIVGKPLLAILLAICAVGDIKTCWWSRWTVGDKGRLLVIKADCWWLRSTVGDIARLLVIFNIAKSFVNSV